MGFDPIDDVLCPKARGIPGCLMQDGIGDNHVSVDV